MHEELRPLLFSIAYRMVGSVGEAEDIVQNAFLRLHMATSEGTEVASPKAFLTTVTTRLAIDHLRSARVRREQYVGNWMPEPLIGPVSEDPFARAEMADSLSIAFMVLLETLSPVERAVYLLREVFDYTYDEIAEIVERTSDNCRQIALRARRKVSEGKPRFKASLQEKEELSRRFFAASQDGDIDGLVALLAEDVVFVGDGGGKVPALPEPVYGRARVVQLLKGFLNQASRRQWAIHPVRVNAGPGAIVRDQNGAIVSVVALDIWDGKVSVVRSIVNPEKLSHLS